MFCILVTGIPASGKSSFAEKLSKKFSIPWLSKDSIKEEMFDDIGFNSRAEKVKLGDASMDIMYYTAEQLMKCKHPFILENNFEEVSKKRLFELLDKYGYTAATVSLTGDYKTIYERFIAREVSPERHRGHVVNDHYPEITHEDKPTMSYEVYVDKVVSRKMDSFTANGPRFVIDTTDYNAIDWESIWNQISDFIFKNGND